MKKWAKNGGCEGGARRSMKCGIGIERYYERVWDREGL